MAGGRADVIRQILENVVADKLTELTEVKTTPKLTSSVVIIEEPAEFLQIELPDPLAGKINAVGNVVEYLASESVAEPVVKHQNDDVSSSENPTSNNIAGTRNNENNSIHSTAISDTLFDQAKIEPVPVIYNRAASFYKEAVKKNLLPVAIIVVLLIGAGGAGFDYFFRQKTSLSDAVNSLTQQPVVNQEAAVDEVTVPVTETTKTLTENRSFEQSAAVEKAVDDVEKKINRKIIYITHVVKKGDTLWDIARTYVKDPFRYPELAALTEIINADLIYPGDVILIPIWQATKGSDLIEN